ncbi:hypothetical protein HerbRD11066_42060 [Herbidospora sp. RD11066]
MDHELYVPRQFWIETQCEKTTIPAHTAFAAKAQALTSHDRTHLTAKLPFARVTADEVYGDNGPLRRFREAGHIAYILAIARSHHMITVAKVFREDMTARKVPRSGRQRLPCGNGAKSERPCDWALVITSARPPSAHPPVDQASTRAGRLPLRHANPDVPEPAGQDGRHSLEHRGMLQTGKNETGLDRYQIRSHPGRYRHITRPCSPWPTSPSPEPSSQKLPQPDPIRPAY